MATNSNSPIESGLSAKMALCIAAITMVGIDEEYKEEELDELRKLIHMDESAFFRAFTFYNEHPLDVCIKVVTAKFTDEQKKVAFHLLYDLAQVDRDFALSEQDLLDQYAAEFGLSKKFVTSVKEMQKRTYDLSAFD